MYSNFYIFRFAAIMVIIVAVILSSAAMFLKPLQDQNVKVEKMKSILTAVNINADADNAIDKYEKYIVKELAINTKGEIVSEYENNELIKGEIRPFELELKKELDLAKEGKDAHLPLYVCEKDQQTFYVIPLRGKGLWGPVWGNMAFEDNFNTVVGTTFDHKGETPGLGAEISLKPFQDQFKGKEIFNQNNEFVSIEVVKGGVANNPNIENIHGVDAITGGTITSNGVSDMIEDNLSLYLPYIKKIRK